MKFLEWAGWAGVSGLLALAALAAALVVTFIELRAWWIAPRSADLAVSISGESGRGGDEMMLTFRFRVIGPHTLHEVAIRRVGGAAGTEKLGDTVNVLSARDGYVERTTVVPSAQRPYHFVASWQERTRFGARMNGVRFGWGARVGMQSWKNYRWPFWPRQVDGRWVDYDYSPSRGARGIYLPDEDRPETLGQRFQRFRGRY